MDDSEIIELYYNRTEAAISKTAEKYGKYCSFIAYNILHNRQDSDECVNDTYLRAWNSIPPENPADLGAFLGKIARNLALDKYRYYNREKRGGSETTLAIDEIQECLAAADNTEQAVDESLLADMLNKFLSTLSSKKRKIFVRRYWYLSSIEEIAKDYSLSESNVKVILLRTRNKLKQFLEKEGVIL